MPYLNLKAEKEKTNTCSNEFIIRRAPYFVNER